MKTELHREFLRKAFHSLSLLYLAAYTFLGTTQTLLLLGGFIIVEGLIEGLRLSNPQLNKRLLALFGGIPREAEQTRVSGILWTSVGCWLTIYFFSENPAIVAAGHLYLAVGDGSAALIGKALGRHKFRIGPRMKSLEGSFACFVACLLSGWAAGLSAQGAWIGACTATAIELLPVPLDDNLWIPLGSAWILSIVL
jgi:phytol kinase